MNKEDSLEGNNQINETLAQAKKVFCENTSDTPAPNSHEDGGKKYMQDCISVVVLIKVTLDMHGMVF